MAGDGSRTAGGIRLRALARPRARVLAAGAATLAVVVPLGLAAVVGAGHAAHLLDQTSGAAWVASPAQGLVTLIDGTSGEAVASVRVAGAGHAFALDQARRGTYLVDQDAGTVSRLDAATFVASAPVAIGTPGGGVTVLQNDLADAPHAVHVLDPVARTATLVDPRTLAVRDEVPLAARPGPGQAVVDDAGDLWALDAGTGTLTRVTPGTGTQDADRTVRSTDTATRTARLVLVRGRPVLVDPARGAVRTVGDDARPGRAGCLDTRSADDVQVLGSATRDEVYVAVDQARSLLVVPTGDDGCGRTVELAAPGGGQDAAQYGELAQSGRFVFVPDRATGATVVVDTAAGTVLDHVALAPAGHRVELRARDSFVFFNDLDSQTAGVLKFAGGRWTARSLEKYDPDTGEGAQVVVPQDERPPVTAPETPGAPPPTAPAAAPPAAPPAAPGGAAPGTRPDPPAAGPPAPGGSPGGTGSSPPGSTPGTRPTPTPSVPPSPPPGITVALATDPAQPGQPEFQPFTEARVVPTVTGAGAGATWTWDVTSAGGDSPMFSEPAPGDTLVLDSVGDGDVTVRLTVTDDGGSASAELLLWVKYVCHVTINGSGSGDDHVVDLRASDAGSFTVEAHECRGTQTASVALPGWLDGPSQITLAPDGSSTTVDVALRGAPPGDGPQSGVVVTFGDDTYPVTVLTDVGPEVLDAEACQVPLIAGTTTQWITRVIVEVRDATVGGADRHVVTGGNGLDVPAADTSGTDRTYDHQSMVTTTTGDPGPPAPPTTVTVTDGFGKSTGSFPVRLHASVPSPCFGGG